MGSSKLEQLSTFLFFLFTFNHPTFLSCVCVNPTQIPLHIIRVPCLIPRLGSYVTGFLLFSTSVLYDIVLSLPLTTFVSIPQSLFIGTRYCNDSLEYSDIRVGFS